MYDQEEFGGYNLIEISPKEWILTATASDRYRFKGSLYSVIKQAVLINDFKVEEFESAVEEMIKNDHNVAHFGYLKNFIYTRQDEFYVRKAS